MQVQCRVINDSPNMDEFSLSATSWLKGFYPRSVTANTVNGHQHWQVAVLATVRKPDLTRANNQAMPPQRRRWSKFDDASPEERDNAPGKIRPVVHKRPGRRDHRDRDQYSDEDKKTVWAVWPPGATFPSGWWFEPLPFGNKTGWPYEAWAWPEGEMSAEPSRELIAAAATEMQTEFKKFVPLWLAVGFLPVLIIGLVSGAVLVPVLEL